MSYNSGNKWNGRSNNRGGGGGRRNNNWRNNKGQGNVLGHAGVEGIKPSWSTSTNTNFANLASTSTSTSSGLGSSSQGAKDKDKDAIVDDGDDWGFFKEPERPPFVYTPAWAKDFPHLATISPTELLANSASYCDHLTRWQISWHNTPSEDEEEEFLSGANNCKNDTNIRPMPSAVLTAKGSMYPNDKPILKSATTGSFVWKKKEEKNIVIVPEEKKEQVKKFVFVYEEKKEQNIVIVQQEMKGAIVSEEKKEQEQAKMDKKNVDEDTTSSSDLEEDQNPSWEGASSLNVADFGTIAPSPTEGQGHTEELCLPLNPNVPFRAKMRGFIDGGFVLMRFCDKATRDQYDNLCDNIWYYFGVERETQQDIIVPQDHIKDGMLAFGKFPTKTPPYWSWCRVRVLKVQQAKNEAICKDLDTWIIAPVPLSEIYYMPPCFLETPFLMHRCRLKGIEFWCVGSVLKELAPLLPNMSDGVSVTSYETDGDGYPLISLEVTLKKNRIGAPIGEKADLKDLFKHVITGFTRIPRQFVKGTLMDRAHISNVDKTGRAWVSRHSSLNQRLTQIGPDPRRALTSEQFNPTLTHSQPLSDFEHAYFNLEQDRFLARFFDDKGLFRVEIKEKYKMGDKEVKVYYLDFGNTEVIPVKDLYPCDLFDPLLAKVVPQIFTGQLNGIASIRDVDEFFEHIIIHKPQEFMITGFKAPNATVLLDVHIKMNETEPVTVVPATAPVEEEQEIEGEGKQDDKSGQGEGDIDININLKDGWTYVNQYIVDKGLATTTPTGVIPFRRVGQTGLEPITRSILTLKELPANVADVKIGRLRAEVKVRSQNNGIGSDTDRFLTSCRIQEEEDGFEYAIVTCKKVEPHKCSSSSSGALSSSSGVKKGKPKLPSLYGLEPILEKEKDEE